MGTMSVLGPQTGDEATAKTVLTRRARRGAVILVCMVGLAGCAAHQGGGALGAIAPDRVQDGRLAGAASESAGVGGGALMLAASSIAPSNNTPQQAVALAEVKTPDAPKPVSAVSEAWRERMSRVLAILERDAAPVAIASQPTTRQTAAALALPDPSEDLPQQETRTAPRNAAQRCVVSPRDHTLTRCYAAPPRANANPATRAPQSAEPAAPSAPEPNTPAESAPGQGQPSTRPAAPPVLAETCPHPGLIGRSLSVATVAVGAYGRVNGHPMLPLQPGEVVLTFDDGPHPRRTPLVLAALERYCAPATFFVVGRAAAAQPGLLGQIVAQGHTVGNHTHSHPILTTVAHARVEQELAQADVVVRRTLRRATGDEQALLPIFRFPGLGENAAVRAIVAARGLRAISVDVVSDDTLPISSDEVARRVIRRLEAHGRGVILFHDTHVKTAQALPTILEHLAANGYRVVALQP